MESLPILWIAAAVFATVSALAGMSELNLTLICAALISVGALISLRQPSSPQAKTPPLVLTARLPETAQSEPARTDRFGGLGPDRLQLVLIHKMKELEQITARNVHQG